MFGPVHGEGRTRPNEKSHFGIFIECKNEIQSEESGNYQLWPVYDLLREIYQQEKNYYEFTHVHSPKQQLLAAVQAASKTFPHSDRLMDTVKATTSLSIFSCQFLAIFKNLF